jgi:chromosome segregation ATPase
MKELICTYEGAIAARKLRRSKDKARTRQDIKAELEVLKPKLWSAEWDVEEAEDELARAENLRDDLKERIELLQEELQPLLKPWEKERPEKECNLLYFGEGAA